MRASDLYPSKYLKAEDFDGDRLFTIRSLVVEELGPERERKPVLYFEGESRGLVCNKTNMAVIVKAYGDETENWRGRQVILYPLDVQFRNDVVRALRVRLPPAASRQPAKPRPSAPAAPPAPPARPSQRTRRADDPEPRDDRDASRDPGQDDDDIPF